MAEISLPKPSRKGEPPKPSETVDNLAKPSTENHVPLQLKIKPEMRLDFRSYAIGHEMDANELFEKVWAFYKEHHG